MPASSGTRPVDQVQRRGQRVGCQLSRGSRARAAADSRVPHREQPTRTDLRPGHVSDHRGRRRRRDRGRCRRNRAAPRAAQRGRPGRRRAPGHHHRRRCSGSQVNPPCPYRRRSPKSAPPSSNGGDRAVAVGVHLVVSVLWVMAGWPLSRIWGRRPGSCRGVRVFGFPRDIRVRGRPEWILNESSRSSLNGHDRHGGVASRFTEFCSQAIANFCGFPLGAETQSRGQRTLLLEQAQERSLRLR
jgi:hypothetical protein